MLWLPCGCTVVVLCCGSWWVTYRLLSFFCCRFFPQIQRRTILLGNRLVFAKDHHRRLGCLWTISWSRVPIVGGIVGLVHFHSLGNFGGSFQRTHGTAQNFSNIGIVHVDGFVFDHVVGVDDLFKHGNQRHGVGGSVDGLGGVDDDRNDGMVDCSIGKRMWA